MKSIALAVLSLILAQAPAQAQVVIAHPSVELTADQVRDLFLGEMQFSGKLRLVPVDNRELQPEFLSRVLQTDERKYTARWTRKTYREGVAAPEVRPGDAEVAAFVRRTPGAVGYVASPTPGVKVLQAF